MRHEIQHVLQVKNSCGRQPEFREVVNQKTSDWEIDIFPGNEDFSGKRKYMKQDG